MTKGLHLETLEDRVTPVIAVNDFYTVDAGAALTIDAVPDGLIANDINNTTPGAQLILTNNTAPVVVGNPTFVFQPNALQVNPNGSFTFIAPPSLQQATVTFNYAVSDTVTPAFAVGTATIEIRPNVQYFATGADVGGGSHVRVFESRTGLERYSFEAFPGFTGGVRVATGDLTGDGFEEIVVGAGPGGGPVVRVYEGATGAPIATFFAYDPAFTGGVYVAIGDVNDDGQNDIITGAGFGGAPHVTAFNGGILPLLGAPPILTSFFAYEPTFRGGVQVATGDLDRLGYDFIITGSGPGGGPLVRAFDLPGSGGGLQPPSVRNFFAYDPAQRGGVNVSTGDFSATGFASIVTGAGIGDPIVNIFDGRTSALVRSFRAFAQDMPTNAVFLGGPTASTAGFIGPNGVLLPPATVPSSFTPTVGPIQGGLIAPGNQFRFLGAMGGVRVATTDRNGDGIHDIVTGPGSGQAPQVRVFSGTDLTEVQNITAYNNAFLGGVFVG